MLAIPRHRELRFFIYKERLFYIPFSKKTLSLKDICNFLLSQRLFGKRFWNDFLKLCYIISSIYFIILKNVCYLSLKKIRDPIRINIKVKKEPLQICSKSSFKKDEIAFLVWKFWGIWTERSYLSKSENCLFIMFLLGLLKVIQKVTISTLQTLPQCI